MDRPPALRLEVDPGFALPPLGGRTLPSRTLTTTYFDTPGGRLHRSGITLCRRVENRAGTWRLSLPSEEGPLELEARGGAGRPPEVLLRLLPAALRGTELVAVGRLRTVREGIAVGPRAQRIEVVVETVTVVRAGRVSGRYAEVVIEVVKGDGARVGAIAKELRAVGARKAAGVTGADLLHAPPAAEPVEDGSPLGRLRGLLAAQYDTVLATDPGVRLGEDPEAVHQMRVATRRSRALLRAARGLVEEPWADGLRRELGWLGRLLGPVRDLDVLLEHLDADAAELDGEDVRAFRRLRARLAAERAADRAALLEGMATDRYLRLLDALEAARDAPAGDLPVGLEQIAAGEFDRLRTVVKKLPKRPADDALHDVRIEAKRARYAAELASPVLGKKAGTRFLASAKVLQDVIGEHQDACVAEKRLRELAGRGGGRTGLAAGRLIERQRRRKRSARRAFPDAWKELDRAGRRAFA